MKASDVLGKLQSTFGEGAGVKGPEIVDVDRLPTGIFPFDLATGGGFPRGKVSILYGPESSGKTNIYLKTIALEQKANPDQVCVFVDVENSFDPEWSTRLGVDVAKLIVLYPKYAEQAVDMVEAVMKAEDVSIVCVDSLAALIPLNEQQSTAEKTQVGGSSGIIGKMMRKIVNVQSTEKLLGHYPTLLLVNQTRYKIGVMFGNPEIMPGGNAHKFASGLTIKTYGKNVVDDKVSKTIPVMKEMSCQAVKWKVPIVSINSVFKMVMIPHHGNKPGDILDWNTVQSYMKDLGMLEKDGNKGWLLLGDHYKTLVEIREAMETNEELGWSIRATIIQAELMKIHGGPVELSNGVE